MVCRPLVVCHPPFSKSFSRTAWLNKAKFHIEPHWDGGTKICSRSLGHMTKMAAMPVYGQKSSSPEPKGQWPCGLVCSIGDSGPIIVCSNDDPWLTLTCFTARSNLVPYVFIWGKTVRNSFNGRWPEWQKVYVKLKILLPEGCLPLPCGCIHVLKQAKICIKSDFKDIFFKLATNGQSDEAFLLTSEFCPQRVVCPCPGAIYM